MIVNKTMIQDRLSQEIRYDNELRGLSYYMLVKYATKHGLDAETFARGGVRKIGQYNRFKNPPTESIPDFIGNLFGETFIKQFRPELVELSDEESITHFHYCPMAGAWLKLTDDEDYLSLICDCAMDVERGNFDKYETIGFDLQKGICKGDDICRIRLYKK